MAPTRIGSTSIATSSRSVASDVRMNRGVQELVDEKQECVQYLGEHVGGETSLLSEGNLAE